MSLPPNIEALIQGIQLDNPRLYQILMGLTDGISTIEEELHPLVIKDRVPPTKIPILPAPEVFTYSISLQRTIRFQWSEVQNAFGYELRQGAVWETATFRLRTPSLLADTDPLLVGTYTFLIKTINSVGVYSDEARSLVVTIPEIGPIVIQQSVIDNNVLLRWNVPTTTFIIVNYRVFKGGILVGAVDSTFFSTFENVSGTYTYRVIPVDVAGNQGPPADVSVQVNAPPDYSLQDSRVSLLLGTRVNVIRDSYIPSLVIAWTTQTWAEHFSTRGWATIADQVAAGYPIYIQPTTGTGSYEEVIDYGVIISSTIVTVTYNYVMHVPDVITVIKMAASNDGVSYTPFVSGASQYVPALRYLKLRLEFTGTPSDKALMELYNLAISLNVKRENDGGEILADHLAHPAGTIVAFKKPFKDIESITCTTQSILEPFYVIFDFVDVPDPVNFKVFAFDSSGNRVTKLVAWKARGIV